MNTNKSFNPLFKFAKGLCAIIVLNLLIVTGSLIFNSCKKNEFETSKARQANAKFKSALALNSQSIGLISFDKQTITEGTRAFLPANDTVVFINFQRAVTPDIEASFRRTNSIQNLSDLVLATDAVIQAEPLDGNTNYTIDISVEKVIESLNPLVAEAKQYLYSKGFTDYSIQEMINENNGTEQDLVTFVMTLTDIESKEKLDGGNHNLLVGQTYAMNEYVRCALVAIGADVLWALSGSSAATWTVFMMTKAFGAVAKRFLGPIGVAIAVVSFGVCLATD